MTFWFVGERRSFGFLQIIAEDFLGKNKQTNQTTLSFQGAWAMSGSGKGGMLCVGNSEAELFLAVWVPVGGESTEGDKRLFLPHPNPVSHPQPIATVTMWASWKAAHLEQQNPMK